MRNKSIIVVVAAAISFLAAYDASAQVKRVQMHIAGYLCGN